MKIILTKKTPTHHQFAIVRSDGSHEEVLLETKSFGEHDLIHFAYESLVPCEQSFYGLLASGKTFKELDDRDYMNNPAHADAELTVTERIVGPLSSYLTTNGTAESFLDGLRNLFEASGTEIPAHMTPEFLSRLKERFRRIIGQWNSLPHGKEMSLVWEEQKSLTKEK